MTATLIPPPRRAPTAVTPDPFPVPPGGPDPVPPAPTPGPGPLPPDPNPRPIQTAMDPLPATPTRPVDYALLSGTFSQLLALSTLTAPRDAQVLDRSDVVPLAVASFALSKLLVHEKVETWIRQPFVEESPEGKRPRGRGLRYAVGELLSCTRCAGAWSALALVSLRLHAPVASQTVTAVLTVSAGNDFLHSGFIWLTARSNLEQARAATARSDLGRSATASGAASAADQPA